MTQTKIREYFHKHFNGQKNFITPTIISYRKQGNLLIEISKGTGFKREDIFGVTVLELDGDETKKSDLSRGVFYSLDDAEEYISEL